MTLPHMDPVARRLLNIGASLSAEKDLRKLMNMITAESLSLTGATAGTLYLIDNEKRQVRFFVTDQDSFNEITMPLNPESIAGFVGLTGQVLNIPDVYHLDPELPFKFNKSFDIKTGFRTKSMLVLPLHSHKGEVLGVLQLLNKSTPGGIMTFDENDMDIVKALASQAAVCIENTMLYREIENLFDSFVRYSSSAIDARDPCTGGHSRRVAMYSVGLARATTAITNEFDEGHIKEIYYAAWLHDIGKIGVREAVLTKANKLFDLQIEVVKMRYRYIKEKIANRHYGQIVNYLRDRGSVDRNLLDGDLHETIRREQDEVDSDLAFILEINVPSFMSDDKTKRLEDIFKKKFIDESGQVVDFLTQEEFENLVIGRGNLTRAERLEMESHVVQTHTILKQIPFTRELRNVPEYAGKHHEKLDGSGYPNRIGAALIPKQVRIITIADIYDALCAQDRPYKKAMPAQKALDILAFEVKDGKLDSDLLKIFIDSGVYKMEEQKTQK